MESRSAAQALEALGHPLRLALLERLLAAGAEGEPAGRLAEALAVPPSTLSYHLGELVAAGLLARRRAGRSVRYAVAEPGLGALLAWLERTVGRHRPHLLPARAPAAGRGGEGDAAAAPRAPTVLFLCSHNAARSQMAEALLRRRAGDRLRVLSAGFRPTPVHPLARRVLEEIGIDTRGLESKDVAAVLGREPIDHAITVCAVADRDCAHLHPFATHRWSWPFEDPARAEGSEEERLGVFRAVRDAIDRRIAAWLASERRQTG